MDKKRLQRFRAALEAQRIELRRSVGRLQHDVATKEDEAAADALDRAGTSYSKDILARRIASERGLLRNVEAALKRIHEGTFGECVSCGKEINVKRLEAVPWARYCLVCQERLERRF